MRSDKLFGMEHIVPVVIMSKAVWFLYKKLQIQVILLTKDYYTCKIVSVT